MEIIRICVICGREKSFIRKGQVHTIQVERGVCTDCKTVRIVHNTPRKRIHTLDRIGVPT